MIQVLIVDPKHPHYSECGTLRTKRTVKYGRVLQVKLHNCQHENIDCFVNRSQVAVYHCHKQIDVNGLVIHNLRQEETNE